MTKIHVCVTGAKSQAHLIYIGSYLRHLLAAEPKSAIKVSFVEAAAFLNAPEVDVDVARRILPNSDRLKIESGMPCWRFDDDARAIYVSVGAPGLKPLVAMRRANPRCKIEVVVTDEGIGTYGGIQQRASAMTRQGAKPALAFAKASAIVAASRLLTTHRWAAFTRSGNTWSINPLVAEEFRRWTPNSRPRSEAVAVIVTQPFCDMGLISEAEQLAYVHALADAAGANGLRPVVRPHPSEPTVRYQGFATADEAGTLEMDPTITQAQLILGGPSTGLVTLSAVHEIPVVWVTIPGLEGLDTGVSRAQAGIFRQFLGAPVSVPSADEAIRTRLADRA